MKGCIYSLLIAANLLSVLNSFGQAPQFSQFYATPSYTNPALTGDARASRLTLNFRNQWASLGTAFNTAVVGFDTYVDPKDIGWGILAIHDQRGQALQSNMLAGQFSKLTYLSSSRELRLAGGIQAAWVSNRWNADNLVYVADLMGVTDPLAATGLSENRFSFSLGTLLEFVPRDDEKASWWWGGSWHNMAVNADKWMGQRFGLQAGTKIPFDSPELFGNHLGHDLDRETALSLAVQVRKQGPLYQLDLGGNLIYSPLLVGLWYRGMGFSEARRDAIIPTLGFLSANILLQVSYDIPVSSLGFSTGALELTLWYGFDDLVRYKGNGRNSRSFLRY